MHRSSLFKDIIYSALAALVFLLWKGYIFNTADTVEPLLLVYKKLEPNLYVGDFYVEAAKDIFTVRFYFVELIVLLAQFMSVEAVCFIGTYLSLFFSSWGILKVSRAVTNYHVSAYFVPFFVSFVFLSWTVGGNVLQYHLFIASNIAKAMGIWGLYFLLTRKYIKSAVLVGLSGLFQVLVGLQLAVLVIGVLVLYKNWTQVLRWSIVWLLVILPMLGPILYRQFFMPEASIIDMERYYHLLYYFRNPDHYLPSLFSPKSFLKLSLLLLLGGASLFYFLPKEQWRRLLVFSMLIILGVVVYTLALEVWYIPAIGKLQWSKTTIWLAAIGAMGIGIAVEYLLGKVIRQKYLFPLALLLPIIFMLKDAFLYQQPISFDHRTKEQKELSMVHQWIYENTDEQAVFATYDRDESFLCEAKRPLTVSINPMIHEPWFMIDWYERYHQQYGVVDTLYNLRQVRRLADQYYEAGAWLETTQADYCLINRDIKLGVGATVFQSEHFKVLSLKEE